MGGSKAAGDGGVGRRSPDTRGRGLRRVRPGPWPAQSCCAWLAGARFRLHLRGWRADHPLLVF